MYAGWRYLADIRRSGPGLTGEILALAAGRLPPRVRMRSYWATNWPGWCRPTISPVVSEPFRAEALAWAQSWIDRRLAEHVVEDRSWMSADAWDSFWPRSYTPPAGIVPEASPFLHEDVVATALALPLTQRYDARLPTRKQYFTQALARAFSGPLAVPVAAAVGLLDPEVLSTETDTAVRMMAAATEAWLAGAIAAGATVSS
jgi:hypothetical protein